MCSKTALSPSTMTAADAAEYDRRQAVADRLHDLLCTTGVQLAAVEGPEIEINPHPRESHIYRIEIEAADLLLLDERRPQPMALQLADALRLGAVALRDGAASLDRMGAAVQQHAEKAAAGTVATPLAVENQAAADGQAKGG